MLFWELRALLDFSIRPNFGKRFRDDFFSTGFMCGELYVISAISGGGKTSIGIQIATTLATGRNYFSDLSEESKAFVIYVTLEQNAKQISENQL